MVLMPPITPAPAPAAPLALPGSSEPASTASWLFASLLGSLPDGLEPTAAEGDDQQQRDGDQRDRDATAATVGNAAVDLMLALLLSAVPAHPVPPDSTRAMSNVRGDGIDADPVVPPMPGIAARPSVPPMPGIAAARGPSLGHPAETERGTGHPSLVATAAPPPETAVATAGEPVGPHAQEASPALSAPATYEAATPRDRIPAATAPTTPATDGAVDPAPRGPAAPPSVPVAPPDSPPDLFSTSTRPSSAAQQGGPTSAVVPGAAHVNAVQVAGGRPESGTTTDRDGAAGAEWPRTERASAPESAVAAPSVPDRPPPVSASPAAAPTGAVARHQASVVAQVVDRIAASLTAGQSRVHLRLEPESLGRVEVRITARNGVLDVHLVAATREAHDALRSGVGGLHDGLRESGYSIGSITVDLSAAQTGSSGSGPAGQGGAQPNGSPGMTGHGFAQGQSQARGDGGWRPSFRPAPTSPEPGAEVAAEMPRTLRRGPGGIDVRA